MPVTDSAGGSTADASPAQRRADRTRQVVVTLAAVCCVVGTLVGTGVIGTPVQDASGGSLSAEATLLAPAGPAFSIWTVIYLGLLCYTGWQWLPATTADPVARRTGWWAAASMLLNAAWLLVTQAGWIWVSVVVIVVLGIVLIRVVALIAPPHRARWPEAVAVHVTFALYLGWVCVASFANVAAALTASGVSGGPLSTQLAAAVSVAAAGALGVLLPRLLGGPTSLRAGIAAAVAWGLVWIGVGRLLEPRSVVVAGTAFLAAAVVLAAVLAPRLRRGARPPGRRTRPGAATAPPTAGGATAG